MADSPNEIKRKRQREVLLPVPTPNLVTERDFGKPLVLEVEHLGIDFGGLTAVDDFNIAMGPTEIAGIIGPNGAGKTTIFNLLTKVYQPTRGTILLNGVDTAGMNTIQVNRLGIARTFQNIRLFSQMTVEQNILVGMNNSMNTSLLQDMLRFPAHWKEEKEFHDKAMDLLGIFNMQKYANELAGNLPYGAQRRLEILRALGTNPKLLLLDEPAAGMNPQETNELTEFIGRIRDEFHMTILLIEHHMDLVMDISDRIYVIDFGELIATGTPEEIQNNQRVIDAYLGVEEDA